MARYFQEKQYLNLIKSIIRNGSIEKGRNGDTITQIGGMMRFNLSDNVVPFITTKKLAWKSCLKELLWFVNGDTNNKILQDNNVSIWNGNATREFLDSRNLHHLQENDLGPVYGHQWRFWNAKYNDCNSNYKDQGIDQLKYIIDELKDGGNGSRRLIMSAWNPEQLDQMALPPCHVLSQFHVTQNNKLSCTLYQRSADMGLGVPFNIASYSLLTHLLAKHCDLEASEFIHFIGNMHIYTDHVDSLKKQLKNKPYDFPKVFIKNKHNDINSYTFNDFRIEGYRSHKKIKMDMRA